MEEKLKSKFLGLYCMILADGVVDCQELETLYRIGRESYDLSTEEIAATVRDSGTSLVLPEKVEEKVQLLYELGEIAWADGKIAASEKALMRRYADRMGFEEAHLDGIVDYILEQVKQKIPLSEIIKDIQTNE